MRSPEPDDRLDEALIQTVASDPQNRAGQAAASELLGRYQQRVYLWCYRYVRERERALDLAQEVLASAWRALPKFRHGSKFSWWMFVTTRNRCINAVPAPSLLRDDQAGLDRLPAASPDPAVEYEQERDEEAVRRLMIEHLDEDERLALWMGCFERMPVEGITQALKLANASGARALLQRARRKLRAALEARAREAT
ncbi:MAG: sigma-70 family RNA polymerase sigma factor [Candidatus Eisenbacteria bacterium]